jgi:O-antigen/teichoic acid export membrane protein
LLWQHRLGAIRRSAFVRNVLVVMSGTGLAQVLGFACSPVISRLYSPQDFGVFGSYGAIVGVIGAGVTLEYSQAIMLPKERGNALGLFVVSCISTLAVTVLCLVGCLFVPATVSGVLGISQPAVLMLLVLAVLVSGINRACQAWCVRVKAFKHTATSQVVRSFTSNSLQIGWGVLKAGAAGLITSSIVADVASTVNLARVVLSDIKKSPPRFRLAELLRLASEYRDFPMYSTSENVINALSTGLPVLLLAHYYGVAVAGAYSFGVRLVSIPMGLVTTALRQVLFQKACETHNTGGSLLELYFRVAIGLFIIAAIPSLIVVIWSPVLFAWAFGEQWRVAGEYARYLMLWLLFGFCNLPAVLFARVVRIQRAVFVYALGLLCARTAILVLGGLTLAAEHTVLAFSLVGAIMNIVLILLVGLAVMRRERGVCLDGMRSGRLRG